MTSDEIKEVACHEKRMSRIEGFLEANTITLNRIDLGLFGEDGTGGISRQVNANKICIDELFDRTRFIIVVLCALIVGIGSYLLFEIQESKADTSTKTASEEDDLNIVADILERYLEGTTNGKKENTN